MAKQSGSILGGFVGRLGNVIGYRWRGRWCMRSMPQAVHNPQTPRQMEHRHAFREQVRLAARMAWPLDVCLTLEARRSHMTCRNLFMQMNQQHFSFSDNELHVDYQRLQLSRGPVAPVEATSVAIDARGVLSVGFDRNPLHRRCAAHDEVFLYAYSPSAGRGYLFNPAYRRTGRISVLLPEWLCSDDMVIYLMVKDSKDRWSPTAATALSSMSTEAIGTDAYEPAPHRQLHTSTIPLPEPPTCHPRKPRRPPETQRHRTDTREANPI